LQHFPRIECALGGDPNGRTQPVLDATEIHCSRIKAEPLTLQSVRLAQIVVRVPMKEPRNAHSAHQVVEGWPAVRVTRWGLMSDQDIGAFSRQRLQFIWIDGAEEFGVRSQSAPARPRTAVHHFGLAADLGFSWRVPDPPLKVAAQACNTDALQFDHLSVQGNSVATIVEVLPMLVRVRVMIAVDESHSYTELAQSANLIDFRPKWPAQLLVPQKHQPGRCVAGCSCSLERWADVLEVAVDIPMNHSRRNACARSWSKA
jgi:hypothetical protein